MAGTHDKPQSPIEAILQNILGEKNELREPLSRNEKLLIEILEQSSSGGSIDDAIETFDLKVFNNVWCRVQFSDKDYIGDAKYAGKPFVVKQGNLKAVCLFDGINSFKSIIAFTTGRFYRYKIYQYGTHDYLFQVWNSSGQSTGQSDLRCPASPYDSEEWYLPANKYDVNRLLPETGGDLGDTLVIGQNNTAQWKRAPVVCLVPFDEDLRNLLQQVTWSMIAPAAKAATNHKASYYAPFPVSTCENFINYCGVGDKGFTDADRLVMINFPDSGGNTVLLKHNGSNDRYESVAYASFSGVVADIDTAPCTYRINATWIADRNNNTGYVVITVEYESPTLLNM